METVELQPKVEKEENKANNTEIQILKDSVIWVYINYFIVASHSI